MHWLLARIYDRLLRPLEDSGLRDWRSRLLSSLSGRVLEVGAGTGLNLTHYPLDSIFLVLSEPDESMRRRLISKLDGRGGALPAVGASLEALPFADGSFETVVATLVLCSVRDLRHSLSEIHRVLRPGGRLLFIEHVAAENNPRRLRWQRRLEPLWKLLAGNCHLTRSTALAIRVAGFEMVEMETTEFPPAALAQPLIGGIAVKS